MGTVSLPEYRITDVTLTLVTKTPASPEEGKEAEPHGFERVTTLQASVSYTYTGLTTHEEYGTVVVDIVDITTVTFDEDGYATQIEHEETPSTSDIMALVTTAVETDLASRVITESEKSYNRRALADVNRVFSEYMAAQSTGESVEQSRFTPQFEGYPELEEWNTGIGAVGFNTMPQVK